MPQSEKHKNEAKRLREFLRADGVEIKHSHALEAVARMHGAKDFHSLSAIAAKTSANAARIEKIEREDPELLAYFKTVFDHDDAYGSNTVLAVSGDGETAYVILESIDKRTGKRDISIDVCIGGEAKTMSEGQGPVATDCPERLIDMTTPTDSEYTTKWRAECRRKIALRKAFPEFRPGDRILFHDHFYPENKETIGSDFTVADAKRFSCVLPNGKKSRLTFEYLYCNPDNFRVIRDGIVVYPTWPKVKNCYLVDNDNTFVPPWDRKILYTEASDAGKPILIPRLPDDGLMMRAPMVSKED